MVVGFAFNPAFTKVLLIKKNKPDWQKGKLNGVGGKVEDFDESSYHAMSREFQEETGPTIPPNQWEKIGSMEGSDWEVDIFSTICHDMDGVSTMTDEPVIWCKVNSLPVNIVPNLSWLVPMAMNYHNDSSLDLVEIAYK